MLWDGHTQDKDVRTSKVDRGYTDYSEEYLLKEAEKVNYEYWKDTEKWLKQTDFTSQKLPNSLPNSPKNLSFFKKLYEKGTKKALISLKIKALAFTHKIAVI